MSTIYVFKSASRPDLRAFAGDKAGSKLPERHGPWRVTGNVRESQPIPHRLDRGTIEQAIDEQGFQLWRLKKALP